MRRRTTKHRLSPTLGRRHHDLFADPHERGVKLDRCDPGKLTHTQRERLELADIHTATLQGRPWTA